MVKRVQLTEQEAREFYESGEWESWSDEQIADFQLFQKKLCVDFRRFHKAVETVLGRSVWTHEFAIKDKLAKEYLLKTSSNNIPKAHKSDSLKLKDVIKIIKEDDFSSWDTHEYFDLEDAVDSLDDGWGINNE